MAHTLPMSVKGYKVVSRARDGGIPPKLTTCPPILERVGADPPLFGKMYVYSICMYIAFAVELAPLCWDIEGDFSHKIWNLDTNLY